MSFMVQDQALTFTMCSDLEDLGTRVAFRATKLPSSFEVDQSSSVLVKWIGAIHELVDKRQRYTP